MDILHIKQLPYCWRCLFSVSELDVSHNWWVKAPNLHHSHFLISHLWVLTPVTWKLIQVIHGRSVYQTTALLLETFSCGLGFPWGIWLESNSSRHALVVPWYNIAFMYCQPIHPSLFDVQVHMTTRLTYMHLMTAYYTATMALLQMIHRFIRKRWLATIHAHLDLCLSFTVIF